jgi:hypothetical protein
MPDSEESEAQQGNADGDVRPSNATAPPYPRANHVAENHADAPNHEAHAAKHRAWNTWLQIGLLVIGSVYSFFAYQQWRVIRGQLEIARLDQRAWVAVTDVVGTPKEGQEFEISVHMKNTGKTFARNLKLIRAIEAVTGNNSSPHFSEDNMDTTKLTTGETLGPALFAPNGDLYGNMILHPHEAMTKEHLEMIESGDAIVYVHGKMTYDDIFGCHHWTTYCFRLTPELKFTACETHNDSDDNCIPKP